MISRAGMTINFAGRMIVGGDFGASKEGGSGRVFLFDEDSGKKIGKALPEKGSAFVCPGGVGNDPKNYTKGITNLISNLIQTNQEVIEKRPESDQELAGIVAAVPTQTVLSETGPYAPVIANIRTSDNKRISADFGDVEKGLAARGIFLSKDFKNFVVNDMNMWTLQTAIAHKDELKEGFKFATFINGGGFGVGYGEVFNVDEKNRLHIRAVEHAHINENGKVLTDDKSSSIALIKNWGEHLGLNDELLTDEQKSLLNKDVANSMLDVLMPLGNSEIVTSNAQKMVINLDDKDKTDEEKNFLRNSIDILKNSEFLNIEEQDGKAVISVAEEKKELAKKASDYSVDKYLDGMAYLSHIKACEGLNKVFLLGPLNAKGVADYVGGTEKLGEIVTQRTYDKLNEVGANMARINNFEVVVDKYTDDSQQALKTLSKGRFMKNTGNSYLIDTDKF